MNPPTTKARKDDEEIRGWIAEAGEFRVETRPEHLEHVRQLLLDHVVLPRPDVIPPDEAETPIGVGLIRLFAVACLVVAVLFGAVYLASRPVDGWARVAQTLHEQTWIHIRSLRPTHRSKRAGSVPDSKPWPRGTSAAPTGRTPSSLMSPGASRTNTSPRRTRSIGTRNTMAPGSVGSVKPRRSRFSANSSTSTHSSSHPFPIRRLARNACARASVKGRRGNSMNSRFAGHSVRSPISR